MKHKFNIGDIDIKTRLNTMQEIDKMSHELYGLSDEEIKIVEGS